MPYFLDFFLHLDKHLDVLISSYGNWSYFILFLIVFCETGLVITPFLPGDSLLFAAGALCAQGSLSVITLGLLLLVAAIAGDALNYQVGRIVGPRVFEHRSPWIRMFFRKEYLEKTQQFYEKYGGKTIIIARFVPIVRTFAPFLAGVGKMNYLKFALYNVSGAVLWIVLLLGAGYLFGGVPVVKRNFGTVILLIIIVSILPAIIEIIRSKRSARAAG